MNTMKMRMASAVAAGALSASLFAGAPNVSDVTLEQESPSQAKITYRLSGAPAIITVDIVKDGVSVLTLPSKGEFSGDVHLVNADGPHAISFSPRKLVRDRKIEGAVAVVTAWSPSNPPDVIVANLLGNRRKEYYTDVKFLPGGLLENEKYRTTAIVLKRVHCADKPFALGPCRYLWMTGGKLTATSMRQVLMPDDFYIGVFELTGSQMACAWNGDPEKAVRTDGLADGWQKRPYMGNSVAWMRGALPPADPTAGSGLGKLKEVTGLEFDLPTCAQWEYAARAGIQDPKYLGSTGCLLPEITAWAATDPSGVLDRVAVWSESDQKSFSATQAVGGKEPNDLGLYDVFGNAYEACRDRYSENVATETPEDGSPLINTSYNTGNANPGYETAIPMRGGAYNDRAGAVNYYYMNWNYWAADTAADSRYGYRLSVTLK